MTVPTYVLERHLAQKGLTMGDASREMTLTEYVTNTLPNSHLANRQLVELHDENECLRKQNVFLADALTKIVEDVKATLRKSTAEIVTLQPNS